VTSHDARAALCDQATRAGLLEDVHTWTPLGPADKS
jgi:hypothetical protein